MRSLITRTESAVRAAIRHIHRAFGRTTGAPATIDEASRPDSLVAHRSATESTQSDGGSSDAEADDDDGYVPRPPLLFTRKPVSIIGRPAFAAETTLQ